MLKDCNQSALLYVDMFAMVYSPLFLLRVFYQSVSVLRKVDKPLVRAPAQISWLTLINYTAFLVIEIH